MNFGEKLKKLRAQANMKQEELAKELGISVRSLSNYETGLRYPKSKQTYQKLADIFNVDFNYLMDEDAVFVESALQSYGNKGRNEAYKLLSDLTGLFAGGKLSEEDRDEIMRLMQSAYWESKDLARKKFGNKK